MSACAKVAVVAAILCVTVARAQTCTAYVRTGTVRASPVMSWTASASTVECTTSGAVPDAMLDITVSFVLSRAETSTGEACLLGPRVACASPDAGAVCDIELSFEGPDGALASLTLLVPGGTSVALPAERLRLQLVAPGELPSVLAVSGGLRCRSPANEGDDDNETVAPLVLEFAVAPALPIGWSAELRAGDEFPSCAEDSCTFELPVVRGPFDRLGVSAADATAELWLSDGDGVVSVEPTRAMRFTVDAIVGNVSCVNDWQAWRAIADESPELLPLRLPRQVMRGVDVRSARHLARLLRMAEHSSYVDQMQAQALAAALNLHVGVPAPDAVADALDDVATVLETCPAEDPVVWNAIKYGYRTCGGIDGDRLFEATAVLSRFNAALLGGAVVRCA